MPPRRAAGPGGERNSPNRALITFLGHASYQIDTPQGVRAITDYNGVNGFGRHPDIVTMNNAHARTSPTIRRTASPTCCGAGRREPGESEARHDVTLKDMRVWNVPTNARDWGTGARAHQRQLDLHLCGRRSLHRPSGHLHHRLTKEHLEELGRIDVLMVPIDGSFTMGVPFMADVIKQIHPKIVLPMHYWGSYQLDRFMGLMRAARAGLRLADSAASRS